METNFIYSKFRNEFGKQCIFSDRGPELIDNYPPDKRLIKDRYIYQEPCHKGTNYEPQYALHEINTEVIEYKTSLVTHVEGGWPKDITYNDLEQTDRYRRKTMKDDSYIHSVLSLSVPIEECIFQNNAVNIYQSYYSDVIPTPFVEQNNCRTVNVYKMPGSPRPITNLSWSPTGAHLAATHCDMKFQCAEPASCQSFIWEVENPNSPDLILTPDCPCCSIEYNTKDPNILCCGLLSGQVGFFDIRRGPSPVTVSPIELAHRDPCTQIYWITSKSNTEFFSASYDGTVKWWDMRNNLEENTDQMVMDISRSEDLQMKRAVGISTLEFESTMPTKFMFGTETGKVVIINRKGKTMGEKIAGVFNAHLGPVYQLQRNTAFLKNFLTIGDWTARIWAEDVRESCIVWTAFHKCFIRDACWSAARYSLFFTARDDGVMDCWDVLQQQYAPIYTMKVSDDPLRKIVCHSEGKMVSLGTASGTVYLIEVSDSMVDNTARDKPFLTAMMERESKREKILEARAREIRLLKSTKGAPAKEDESIASEAPEGEDPEVVAAELEYFTDVEKALAQYQQHDEVPKGTLGKLEEETGLDKKKTMDSEEISENLLSREADDGDNDELELK